MFEFQNPGRITEGELRLVLDEKYPGNPEIGFVPAYRFQIRLVDDDTPVGRIELRLGNTEHIIMYSGHIGYEIMSEYRGRRYAARACKLLFPLARRHSLETIWITCNPDNIASVRTCELAGGELIDTVNLPENTDAYRKGERQKRRYRFKL